MLKDSQKPANRHQCAQHLLLLSVVSPQDTNESLLSSGVFPVVGLPGAGLSHVDVSGDMLYPINRRLRSCPTWWATYQSQSCCAGLGGDHCVSRAGHPWSVEVISTYSRCLCGQPSHWMCPANAQSQAPGLSSSPCNIFCPELIQQIKASSSVREHMYKLSQRHSTPTPRWKRLPMAAEMVKTWR